MDEEEDEDTDEDQNQEQPDFAPHDTQRRSLSRGVSGDSGGLGANAALRQKGPQLLAQTEEDVEDSVDQNNQDEETIDDQDETFEIETEGIETYGPESSRKSLSKGSKKSIPGDIEMQTIKRGARSP